MKQEDKPLKAEEYIKESQWFVVPNQYMGLCISVEEALEACRLSKIEILQEVIQEIEDKLSQFPNDDNLPLSARGMYDGYLNSINLIKSKI
jgi:hypothetical protein